MPLAALLSVWIARHGLLPEDAAAICRRCLAPDRVAAHRFAADLITEISANAAEVLRRKNRDAAAARLRSQHEPDPEAVQILTKHLNRVWNDQKM
jgi:hypothetical protein